MVTRHLSPLRSVLVYKHLFFIDSNWISFVNGVLCRCKNIDRYICCIILQFMPVLLLRGMTSCRPGKVRLATFGCNNKNPSASIISWYAFSVSLASGFWFDDQHQTHGTLNNSQMCDDRFVHFYGQDSESKWNMETRICVILSRDSQGFISSGMWQCVEGFGFSPLAWRSSETSGSDTASHPRRSESRKTVVRTWNVRQRQFGYKNSKKMEEENSFRCVRKIAKSVCELRHVCLSVRLHRKTLLSGWL